MEALVNSLRDQITSAVNRKAEAVAELEKCQKKSADVAVELGIQALYLPLEFVQHTFMHVLGSFKSCIQGSICAWMHGRNVHARKCA